MMKKIAVFIFVVCSLFLLGYGLQILQEKSLVVNIEVPTRVYHGDTFVENLKISDFQIFEDGIPQKIEAVYLVKKDQIARKEEKIAYQPNIKRDIFLFMEVMDYDKQLGDAIDHFVKNVLLPNDNLIAVTPLKTYRLKDKGMEYKTRQEIADELKGYLKVDTKMGLSEYRNIVNNLQDLVKELRAVMTGKISSDDKASPISTIEFIPELLTRYRIQLERLELIRKLEEEKLLEFAEYLKTRSGQKYVFMFYQREFVPQLEPIILNTMLNLFQDIDGMDILYLVTDINDFYVRAPDLNLNLIRQKYADASTSIHFLFLTRPAEQIPGIYFAERSNDIFATFAAISKASGGLMDSSANPNYLMNKAVDASDNYYLLYYTPKNYRNDGKFKKIDVRIKGKNYRILHRAGYYAN